jgi:hypothetical protein
MTKRFEFDRENATRVVTVFAWSAGSAFVAMLIALVGVVQVPVEYAVLIPITNTILYALKEWIEEQRVV